MLLCDQQSLRLACAYPQSDQSLCLSLEYFMNVKLLTEHHLEFLSLKEDCTGSSESTLVKMPHFWKSHAKAHFVSTVAHIEPPKIHSHIAGVIRIIKWIQKALSRGGSTQF